MKIYAIAFRHVIPGEGVGGTEWDPSLEVVRGRIAALGIYDDLNYEVMEREIEVTLTDRGEITDLVDGLMWDKWSR